MDLTCWRREYEGIHGLSWQCLSAFWEDGVEGKNYREIFFGTFWDLQNLCGWGKDRRRRSPIFRGAGIIEQRLRNFEYRRSEYWTRNGSTLRYSTFLVPCSIFWFANEIYVPPYLFQWVVGILLVLLLPAMCLLEIAFYKWNLDNPTPFRKPPCRWRIYFRQKRRQRG